MAAPKARVPLIFGKMTFGEEGNPGVRTSSLPECQKILDVFLDLGYNELDAGRLYGGETTEGYLEKLDLGGAAVDTKVWPHNPGDLAPAPLEAQFCKSLAELNATSVRALYLHKPDRSVPFEETCREVAEVVGICKANGWVQPKIYQAMYNSITRSIEAELVPCLRKFGIRLVIYQPLAGGFFSGVVPSSDATAPKGSRFDTSNFVGQYYSSLFLKQGYFDALKVLQHAAEQHNIRLTELALRWIQHHSVLTPEDGVILGASSAAQLAQNCEDSAKGPLDEALVRAMEEANGMVWKNGDAPRYWL